jgi:hypothetical protein
VHRRRRLRPHQASFKGYNEWTTALQTGRHNVFTDPVKEALTDVLPQLDGILAKQ